MSLPVKIAKYQFEKKLIDVAGKCFNCVSKKKSRI